MGATFEAVVFEPVAFAAVLAVLSGIELLLFFEDFVADAFLAFIDALARPLVALRLTVAAFFVVFEALFLRVFCDTACARNRRAPVRVSREPLGPSSGHNQDSVVECAYNSTFSVKINGLCLIPARLGRPLSRNTG